MNHSPGLDHPNRTPEQVSLERMSRTITDPMVRMDFIRTLIEMAQRECTTLTCGVGLDGQGEGSGYDAWQALDRLSEMLEIAIEDNLPGAETDLKDWVERQERER